MWRNYFFICVNSSIFHNSEAGFDNCKKRKGKREIYDKLTSHLERGATSNEPDN